MMRNRGKTIRGTEGEEEREIGRLGERLGKSDRSEREKEKERERKEWRRKQRERVREYE